MPILTLDRLAQEIAEHETQLKTLRREHAARHAKLAALEQRKKRLQSNLRELDAEIQEVTSAVSGSGTGNGKSAKTERTVKSVKAASTSRAAELTRGASLASLIIDAVRRAEGQPVLLKDLAKQVLARFSTQSRNPYKMVEIRAYELARRGNLRRIPQGGGFLLAKKQKGAKADVAVKKATESTLTKPGKTTPKAEDKGNRAPLRDSILSILRRAKQPLRAQELAEKVLASGYATKSQNFRHVIWVALGKMNDVVVIAPEGGYRLKTR